MMAFEDNIANDVRGDLRQLRTTAELYRIQQRVVELSYRRCSTTQTATLFAPRPRRRQRPRQRRRPDQPGAYCPERLAAGPE